MFNTEEAKTAAESPWSNGVCEHHNAVIKESVTKTMDETSCKQKQQWIGQLVLKIH